MLGNVKNEKASSDTKRVALAAQNRRCTIFVIDWLRRDKWTRLGKQSRRRDRVNGGESEEDSELISACECRFRGCSPELADKL